MMDIERFEVLGHKSFDPALDCRPRPDPKIWVPKKRKQKRMPWLFETSVFKDWKFDTDVRILCDQSDLTLRNRQLKGNASNMIGRTLKSLN